MESVESLKEALRGRVVLPEDADFDQMRQVYNGMIDKRPGLIVICVDVADIVACIKYAKANGLEVAIRGGGHNGGGLGICDGGLVIDMSGIKYVRVDTSDNTVRVGGGNLWGEVDHALYAYGLAIPAGIISTTGVSGLTLRGGVGHLSRKYGLTIDNLLEVDMVLADGSLVVVNAEQNQDLFWAIRGGGGNFGVVTSFKFQAHPLQTVIGGPTLWPIEQTETVMAWYHDFIHKQPQELNGFIATMVIPGPPFPDELHNKQFCGIVWCYAGDDQEKFNALFEEVRKQQPLFEHVGPMPYPAIQTLFDGMMPPGMQWYWRADFFDDIQAGASAVHREFGSKIPTPLSQMHLYPITGAPQRVGPSDTAWAYRDAKYAGVIVGVDPSPDKARAITDWCKAYWNGLHPYSMGGAYSNFMMDEGQDRVKASYRQNYERLVQVKSKYDPTNFFHINQNIVPK